MGRETLRRPPQARERQGGPISPASRTLVIISTPYEEPKQREQKICFSLFLRAVGTPARFAITRSQRLAGKQAIPTISRSRVSFRAATERTASQMVLPGSWNTGSVCQQDGTPCCSANYRPQVFPASTTTDGTLRSRRCISPSARNLRPLRKPHTSSPAEEWFSGSYLGGFLRVMGNLFLTLAWRISATLHS